MLGVTVRAFAPREAVTMPSVSAAADCTLPFKMTVPERMVTGAVSLMRLLSWVWRPLLLFSESVAELSSIAEVLSSVASFSKISHCPERAVLPV